MCILDFVNSKADINKSSVSKRVSKRKSIISVQFKSQDLLKLGEILFKANVCLSNLPTRRPKIALSHTQSPIANNRHPICNRLCATSCTRRKKSLRKITYNKQGSKSYRSPFHKYRTIVTGLFSFESEISRWRHIGIIYSRGSLSEARSGHLKRRSQGQKLVVPCARGYDKGGYKVAPNVGPAK
jgi:hypothetical protein